MCMYVSEGERKKSENLVGRERYRQPKTERHRGTERERDTEIARDRERDTERGERYR